MIALAVAVVVAAAAAYGIGAADLVFNAVLATAALAALVVRSWWSPPRRRPPAAATAPVTDLMAERIQAMDAYVAERSTAGDSVDEIASAATWFYRQERPHG